MQGRDVTEFLVESEVQINNVILPILASVIAK